MELPHRPRGDELLRRGALGDLLARLRTLSRRWDLTSVIAYAFDRRTRMLPFIYADMKMVPAGVRAIGAALFEAGFEKTRIVLQQWNPNFRPSQMRLDGRIPDLFLVSSMHIHETGLRDLIRDACRIDPARRPLVVAGGPKVTYQPWDVFSADPRDPWAADVAVTGEEYVLLQLLEILLCERAGNESLRSTFIRAREAGLLEGTAGLVYSRSRANCAAEELIDTGIQRLLGDLDELPHPIHGFQLLEPASRGATLQPRALAPEKVRKHSPIASLVLTFGCKFRCTYCPIPAYNQLQYRFKSGERIADEMGLINARMGIRHFFGADDNFFNDHGRTLGICETLVEAKVHGVEIGKVARWGTEATVHDTLKMKDHLKTMRRAGLRMIWLGVEDLTARFVKKGQNIDKTTEAFQLLKRQGIAPMPMMMHHDGQPLYTPGSPYGLLNQVKILRKAGALSLQVLMMTPATGSKSYEEIYASGSAYESVGGKRIEPHMLGATYVVASKEAKPWRKQFNILLAYLYFYNPLRLLVALVRPVTKLWLADSAMQILGMWGLAQTMRRTLGWGFRLMRGPIRRGAQAPTSAIPMRSPNGTPAPHALPGAPLPVAGTDEAARYFPLKIHGDVCH